MGGEVWELVAGLRDGDILSVERKMESLREYISTYLVQTV